MAETAAYLVECVIPRVPVRQWVLSFPIPLRSLFAVHPELLTPVLQIIHRVIATHLIKQADVKRSEAATGAVTLIQRFGSAANLNIHLHGHHATTVRQRLRFQPACGRALCCRATGREGVRSGLLPVCGLALTHDPTAQAGI